MAPIFCLVLLGVPSMALASADDDSTEPPGEDKSLWQEIQDFYSDPNHMAMYCVLPIIVLIYGGCSAIYCVHKCRRYIRRRSHKHQHSDMEDLVAEDERNDLNKVDGDTVTSIERQPIATVSGSSSNGDLWDDGDYNVQAKKTVLPWNTTPQVQRLDSSAETEDGNSELREANYSTRSRESSHNTDLGLSKGEGMLGTQADSCSPPHPLPPPPHQSAEQTEEESTTYEQQEKRRSKLPPITTNSTRTTISNTTQPITGSPPPPPLPVVASINDLHHHDHHHHHKHHPNPGQPPPLPRPIQILPLVSRTRVQGDDYHQPLPHSSSSFSSSPPGPSSSSSHWDPLHLTPFQGRGEGREESGCGGERGGGEGGGERKSGRESAWSIRDEIMAKYEALTSLAMAKKTAEVLRMKATRGAGGGGSSYSGHPHPPPHPHRDHDHHPNVVHPGGGGHLHLHHPDQPGRKPGVKKKMLFIAE